MVLVYAICFLACVCGAREGGGGGGGGGGVWATPIERWKELN